MPKAEIITIGTEVLLGEIVDTNTQAIARMLRDEGIDLFWASTVGDNVDRIAGAIHLALSRSDIILTTGGLGPTIDDPTRDAVAQAFNVETEYRAELWQQIVAQFAKFNRIPTENNKRQAYVPTGAIEISNPVGTAPAFIMEDQAKSLISLPGVPSEMEHLMQHNALPYLREKFDLSEIIKTRILRTAGVGESQIDDLITDLEKASNPTLGLAAHAGAVDLRITAKAEDEAAADEMISGVEMELRNRLGDWIYGVDQDTLADAAMRNIMDKGWCLSIIESGLDGHLCQALENTASDNFTGGEILSHQPDLIELRQRCQESVKGKTDLACLGVVLSIEKDHKTLHLVMISPHKESSLERSYGGASKTAPLWAVSLCLDYIRKLI